MALSSIDNTKIYFRLCIIASLAGPTPIHSMGTPMNCSMNSTYFLQFAGNSSYLRHFEISDCQPGRVSYLTLTFSGDSFSKSATVERRVSQVSALLFSPRTWERSMDLAVDLIRSSNLQLRQLIQYVQFREIEARIAIDHVRVSDNDKIKPSAPTSTSGCDTVFCTNFLQVVSG